MAHTGENSSKLLNLQQKIYKTPSKILILKEDENGTICTDCTATPVSTTRRCWLDAAMLAIKGRQVDLAYQQCRDTGVAHAHLRTRYEEACRARGVDPCTT